MVERNALDPAGGLVCVALACQPGRAWRPASLARTTGEPSSGGDGRKPAATETLTTGLEVRLEQRLALERELQQRLLDGEDTKEGIAAYNTRRPLRFSGK